MTPASQTAQMDQFRRVVLSKPSLEDDQRSMTCPLLFNRSRRASRSAGESTSDHGERIPVRTPSEARLSMFFSKTAPAPWDTHEGCQCVPFPGEADGAIPAPLPTYQNHLPEGFKCIPLRCPRKETMIRQTTSVKKSFLFPREKDLFPELGHPGGRRGGQFHTGLAGKPPHHRPPGFYDSTCLLYTSDAADE